jgi:hypothetical protein
VAEFEPVVQDTKIHSMRVNLLAKKGHAFSEGSSVMRLKDETRLASSLSRLESRSLEGPASREDRENRSHATGTVDIYDDSFYLGRIEGAMLLWNPLEWEFLWPCMKTVNKRAALP